MVAHERDGYVRKCPKGYRVSLGEFDIAGKIILACSGDEQHYCRDKGECRDCMYFIKWDPKGNMTLEDNALTEQSA